MCSRDGGQQKVSQQITFGLVSNEKTNAALAAFNNNYFLHILQHHLPAIQLEDDQLKHDCCYHERILNSARQENYAENTKQFE